MGYSRLSVDIGQIKPRAGVEKIFCATWLKDLRSDSGHLRVQKAHDPWVLAINHPQEFPSPPCFHSIRAKTFLSHVFTASFYSPPTLLSYACPAIPGGHFPNPSLPYVALSSPLLLCPLGSLRIQPAVLGFFQKPGHYSQFPISPAASDWPS